MHYSKYILVELKSAVYDSCITSRGVVVVFLNDYKPPSVCNGNMLIWNSLLVKFTLNQGAAWPFSFLQSTR